MMKSNTAVFFHNNKAYFHQKGCIGLFPMEDPQLTIPWVSLPTGCWQWETISVNKDNNKKILQTIPDSWHVESEYKAEQGKFVIQI